MDKALRIAKDERLKVVAYEDNLAVLTAGTNLEIIKERIYAERSYILRRKSQVMSLKGGLRPGFTVPFGDNLITPVSLEKNLAVIADYKRNFWAHHQMVAGKSDEL